MLLELAPVEVRVMILLFLICALEFKILTPLLRLKKKLLYTFIWDDHNTMPVLALENLFNY